MIEALIKAAKECIDSIDVNPNKTLKPIGAVFKEWAECPCSTGLPHWIYWKVDEYTKVFRGRSGNTMRYERAESIVGISESEYKQAL